MGDKYVALGSLVFNKLTNKKPVQDVKETDNKKIIDNMEK